MYHWLTDEACQDVCPFSLKTEMMIFKPKQYIVQNKVRVSYEQ